MRCQPYPTNLVQADAGRKQTRYSYNIKLTSNLNQVAEDYLRLSWLIDQRPDLFTQRGRIGDFEINTFVESRVYSKTVLLMLLVSHNSCGLIY